jgi:hypothetical protein
VEIFRHLPPSQNGDVILALRTEHELYVEYQSGPRELYDLDFDPYQLQNVYATADPAHIAALSQRLAELAVSGVPEPSSLRLIGLAVPAPFRRRKRVDNASVK